ncbi:bifunctional metallophosphatase/5'-nucleotidase [Paradesertivirga mongoliensis]|uniref:Bifunctional metallophosphatase/5'-nucleotidase n=1 Tax=Paradesertivirga mongoliensis TaxID=2100740 RepID=A0ABW4ZGF5_9SPHI|nr:metallophosphatase [Pedobacter mongoliensis]
MNRRNFLQGTVAGSVLFALGLNSESLYAASDFVKLTILHTNDVHSRIDPFPLDDEKFPGRGGVAPRSALINKIRQQEKNVLLFDAGDLFQGSPYFNYYGGELEMKLMSKMGYDAGTMGNHEFDNGIEGFHKQLPHASFPFLTSNYDFTDTILRGKTKDYQVFKKDGLKVGVFGLCIELSGIVNKEQYGNTRYLDPLKKALEIESFLKKEEKCDLVICLSHLGYDYRNNKISDKVIAKNTHYIDLIIGGHTHTFLDVPDSVKNLNGNETLINQVGYGGVNLGRLDFVFERDRRGKKTYSAATEQINSYFKF